MHPKHANPNHPIHDIFKQRWSPYQFSERKVSRHDLASIFEAASWAASSFNEQPWRYIMATKDEPEEFQKVLSSLNEKNREWARNAPVLALGVKKKTFTHSGEPNRVALHDLGAASATLTYEATLRDLNVHQMAGILPDKAREIFGVPDDYDVEVGIAIGYPAEDGPFIERDRQPRTRKPLDEFVFSGSWGHPAEL